MDRFHSFFWQRPADDNEPSRGIERPRKFKKASFTHPNPGGSRDQLSRTAKETLALLPKLTRNLRGFNAYRSVTFRPYNIGEIASQDSPTHAASPIEVLNKDSFNAAIDLYSGTGKNPRVAVLNMANGNDVGGGFLRGAFAQEELLCYRSSLFLSLRAGYYPWRAQTCLYSPDVVIMRSDFDKGHKLLWGLDGPLLDCPNSSEYNPAVKKMVPTGVMTEVPENYKVSVVSIAAFQNPKLQQGAGSRGGDLFQDPEARDMTKNKMRLAVQVAVKHGHEVLVLGALGCGAFRNPKEDVASCWLEVLREPMFEGRLGKVVFAVLDNKNDGNFRIFGEILHGQVVG